KNVLQIDPKSSDAYFVMGQIQEKDKEYGKALGYYKKAIELDPVHMDAKIRLSKIYVIIGTKDLIEEARKLLHEAKKVQPEDPQVGLILSTIDYKLGEKEKATLALEKVVAKNSSFAEGVSLLSTFYTSNGASDKAVKLLTKGVADNPKDVFLKVTLAKLLAKKKDYKGAEKYLTQSVSIDPQNYSLQIALSLFYTNTDQKDKAEVILRKAIEQDDNDVQRYLMLVEFLSAKNSIAEGEAELIKAIKNKPELYSLKFSQVQFYKKIGKSEKMKEILKQIIAEKSYDVEGVQAKTQMAAQLLKEGDKAGAKTYADEVIAEYPKDSDALLIVSKLALLNSDAIEAINGFRTILKNDPKNAEAALLLARAHEMNGESSLAENELKKSIEADPVNAQTHINYARYLASKNRMDEAVDVADKALTYFKNSYDLLDFKLRIFSVMKKDEAQMLAILDAMEIADPSRHQVHITRGRFFQGKKEQDKALKQFEIAYVKAKDKYQPLELIVKLHMQNSAPDKALLRLKGITDKKPDDAVANYFVGLVYMAQSKPKQAREKFLQASRAAEKWLPPYTGLASSYVAEKDLNMAIKVYQDAMLKLVNKLPAQLQIASLYERQKDYTKAMGVYKAVLDVNANNKLAANNYASLLLDYGTEADAVKALALSKTFEETKQTAFQDTLGWAYVKNGDTAKAVEVLKPVVEKTPNVAVFRYHLGYALYKAGDKAAAKSHLEIAVNSEQTYYGKDEAAQLLKTL
ncbi:hypothetical protein MNBD_GAMMA11-3107, partial [hydrothermal vent metagenome]